MHRRHFCRALVRGGFAAPALLGGFSTEVFGHDDNDRIDPPAFGRVALRLAGVRRLISRFAVVAEDGISGIDLRYQVPQMAADRFDLGEVPLINQIFTPTLKRQFGGAAPAGALYLVGDVIVLVPSVELPAARRRVWITHRKVVFRPPASIKPMQLDRPLTPERIASAPRIGRVVLKDDILLAIVPPSVLDAMEFNPPGTV